MKKTFQIRQWMIIGTALFAVTAASHAFAQEIDCLKCHAKLKSGKVLHAAVDMGCATCHGGIDAAKTPHKKTNKIAGGLNSDQPDLCYGCHDKKAFEKKSVHAAVGMGCTGCHDPHSSNTAKLLKSEVPELCFTCHDKKGFTGKIVHAPVAGGMCLGCHTPHASDQISLLAKKPVDICAECHPAILKAQHAVSGISGGGHPVTSEKKRRARVNNKEWKEVTRELADPARPGKIFYCASCHEPHSANVPLLLRYNAKSGIELCGKCHKY